MTSFTEEEIQQEIDDIAALCENDEDPSWLDLLQLNDSKNQSTSNQSFNVSSSVLQDLDENTKTSWLFPIKGFEKRDYQLNISKTTLFHNTLVILPTGLGKTFIASVTIYNFMRWFPLSKIVFMAPTRPLVNQQMSACYDVVGIPKEETAEMTGKTASKKRKQEWESKRVFFATPQVIQSDIKEGIFPSTAIKLLVFDEAHKAKGGYAYCRVIEEVYRVNQRFRVLALTATAGKSADVIQIIQNLLISKIEHRSESSIDVCRYTHKKTIDIVPVKLGKDLQEIYDNFITYVNPFTDELQRRGLLQGSQISKGSLIMARKRLLDNRSINFQSKSNDLATFSEAIGFYHSLEILQRHSVHLFLKSLRDDDNKTNYKFFIAKNSRLRQYVGELDAKYESVSPFQLNLNTLPNGEVPSFADKIIDFGHPKFDILRTKLKEYFNDKGTKAIIFCEYRDTTHLIYAFLLQFRPQILPNVLIGQGGNVSQKQQLKIMKEFREGKSNTLICTCVAEEGLDIGEVDLVVCYDINSKNAVRFVQRIGRTARKRSGKVIVLATEGKELSITKDLVFSKNQMNKSISRNNDISNYLFKPLPLFPKDFNPQCIELKFIIPQDEEVIETDEKPAAKSNKPAKSKTKKKVEPITSKGAITNYLKPITRSSSNVAVQNEKIEDVNEDVEVISSPVHVEPTESPEKVTADVCDSFNINEILDRYKDEIEKIKAECDIKEGSYKSAYIEDVAEKEIDNMMTLATRLSAPLKKNYELALDNDIDISIIKAEDTRPVQKFLSPSKMPKKKFMPAAVNSPLPSVFSNLRNSSTPIRKGFSPMIGTSKTLANFVRKEESPEKIDFLSQAIENLNNSLQGASQLNTSTGIQNPVENKFDFLGIMSIDDIFEGCDSKIDFSTSKSIGRHLQSPTVDEHASSDVFKKLNISKVEDIFDSSNDAKDSDQTQIYDVDEEIARIEESRNKSQAVLFDKSEFAALESETPEILTTACEAPCEFKENDDSFLKKTDSKPNLSKLMSSMQSSSTFPARIVLQERNLASPQLKADTPPIEVHFATPTKQEITIGSAESTPDLKNHQVTFISPSPKTSQPKFGRAAMPKRRRLKNSFLCTQAGVDDTASSDEHDEHDTSLNGFVCNETVAHDQTTMYAKYLQSLQSPRAAGAGRFILRPLNPANLSDIYTQYSEEEEDDSMGSFIVEGEEDAAELSSEVDELELAEKVLREKRRKRKLDKNEGKIKKKRKIVIDSSTDDDDHELEKLRREVLENPD